MSYNLDHYTTIEKRLHHMKALLKEAKTKKEREWCQHRVDVAQRELDSELEFIKKCDVDWLSSKTSEVGS